MPTINERPKRTPKSPLSQRFNAARSSSDLHLEAFDSREVVGSPAATDGRDAESMRSDPDEAFVDGVLRRVQKDQINALSKRLSALRRTAGKIEYQPNLFSSLSLIYSCWIPLWLLRTWLRVYIAGSTRMPRQLIQSHPPLSRLAFCWWRDVLSLCTCVWVVWWCLDLSPLLLLP